jgi:DNA modification methylase
MGSLRGVLASALQWSRMNLGPFEVPGYHVGDCRRLLAQLPDESVDCVVTSPPYWALRDYGLPPLVWGGDLACSHRWGDGIRVHRGGPHGDGLMLKGGRDIVVAQAAVKDIDAGVFCEACGAWRGHLGLEPSPQLFVEHLVEVGRAIWRVMRPGGTLWLNLGDTYASSAGGYDANSSRGKSSWPSIGTKTMSAVLKGSRRTRALRDGNHAGMAAQGSMAQPNRLPLPGLKPKDLIGIPWRVAFALQDDGWWLRSDIVWAKPNPMPESVTDRPTKAHEYLFLLAKSPSYYYDAEAIKEPASDSSHPRGSGVNPKAGKNERTGDRRKDGFNERWRVKQNASFSAAVSGTVESRNKRSVWTIPTEPTPDAHFATFPRKLVEPCILAGCPVGGIVLDPFGGSGTVGRVAEDHGRRWLLFDLNPNYAQIARRKTAQTGLLGRVAAGGG